MYFFKPTYKTYDHATYNDETTNEIYRKEMLQIFELDEFDLEKINLKIKELLNNIQDNKNILNCLEKYKNQYNLDDMELTLLRSLMDKKFYDDHRGSRCPNRLFSLFQEVFVLRVM